jgi:hypothetical protein
VSGPLSGVRVVDCTTVVLGPWAAQQLGDLGADVIKVEPPEGDTTRQLGPMKNPGMGAFYLAVNRNKRSIVLDLKQPAARDVLLRLARDANVLLHNYRPQAARRLGMSYETFSAANPGLVYVGTYGFRATGPYGDKPAYDDIIQAASGIASLQASIVGEPRYVPTIVADKSSSMTVLAAVLAALYHQARTGLGVTKQEVVPLWESTHGGLPVEAGMGACAIIVLQPPREDPPAIRRGVVGAPVGPLAQRRLDEALRFAVRAGRVGAGPAMEHAQRPTGGPKAVGAIGRAVVGQDPAHADAVGAEPPQRAPQKVAGGGLPFVGEQLHIRDARVIVDGDVQVLPAGAADPMEALAGHAVPQAPNAAQLLGIEVEQVADRRVLVALRDRRGCEAPAPRQPTAPQHPRHRGRTHRERGADLPAGPLLAPQHLGGELHPRGREPRAGVGPARAVHQARPAVGLIARAPLPGGVGRHGEHARQALERLAGLEAQHQFLSTSKRESGILVDVHPGLLSRVSNDLAATTFPRSAWVNNLLLRHS